MHLDRSSFDEPRGPEKRSSTPSRAPAGRKRLVSRLWRTAEQQVAEIEARLMQARDDPQALERDAKTLAIVTRTVRDLVSIDAEAQQAGEKDRQEKDRIIASRAEPSPKSIAAFRAELALRLDQLRQERPGEGLAGALDPGFLGESGA